jgi:hypothetical protein
VSLGKLFQCCRLQIELSGDVRAAEKSAACALLFGSCTACICGARFDQCSVVSLRLWTLMCIMESVCDLCVLRPGSPVAALRVARV